MPPSDARPRLVQCPHRRKSLMVDVHCHMDSYDPRGHIAGVRGFSQQERDQILGGNAARLLGIDAGVTATA
jgi:predicted TIM-barrel fold metal-dependent hydrolase